MRAAKFARDAWPEQTPGEVVMAFDQRGQVVHGSQLNVGGSRSWEELDCPDEIELELIDSDCDPHGNLTFEGLIRVLTRAGLANDMTGICHPSLQAAEMVCATKQAEDCWYAGVPRGRRLVLRRI